MPHVIRRGLLLGYAQVPVAQMVELVAKLAWVVHRADKPVLAPDGCRWAEPMPTITRLDPSSAKHSTGDQLRLAHNAALQRSIRHCFPYIDPLHHLQVELVCRYREGNSDERIKRGIHISINGIAAGLRIRAECF